MLKKEKTKIGDAHDKLAKDLENLVKDYKASESEKSLLINSSEPLQSRLDKYYIASSSTSSICDHAKIIEVHDQLKEDNSLYFETNKELEDVITKYGLEYYPTSSTCEKAT